METNHEPENPGKSIATSEDDDQGSITPLQTRSYECSFCKRGFSNAQALGGHMNIHRKQKAKLKQPSSTAAAAEPPRPKTVAQDMPSFVSSMSPPWFLQDVFMEDKDNNLGQIEQLPLFVEKPLYVGSSDKSLCSSQGSDSEHVLDLELRLGPDQPVD